MAWAVGQQHRKAVMSPIRPLCLKSRRHGDTSKSLVRRRLRHQLHRSAVEPASRILRIDTPRRSTCKEWDNTQHAVHVGIKTMCTGHDIRLLTPSSILGRRSLRQYRRDSSPCMPHCPPQGTFDASGCPLNHHLSPPFYL